MLTKHFVARPEIDQWVGWCKAGLKKKVAVSLTNVFKRYNSRGLLICQVVYVAYTCLTENHK